MELLQLEYFLKVARAGNMRSVADSMHVSQSSISRSVSRLEESLGFQLFDRIGRKLVLNKCGQMYYRHVEEALQQLADGRQRVNEYISQSSKQLSFSVPIARLVQQPLVDYLLSHTDLQVRQLCIPEIDNVRTAIERRDIDFALTFESIDNADFSWTKLLDEHFYYLVPKGHALADRKSITLRELDGERVIMHECDGPEKLISACERVGASLNVVYIGCEIDGTGTMLENGLGGSFIPAYSQYMRFCNLPEKARALVSVIPIEDDWFKRELGIVAMKHRYISDAAMQFRKYLIHYYSDVAKKLATLS